MDRSHIEKIAKTQEEKMLLAKIWDKINNGIRRGIPANTPFLAPRELEMAHYLFGEPGGLYAFGGYDDAERKMLIYLPDYLETDYLLSEDSPIDCIHTTFHESENPSHRDFLGALLGCGIGRETIGDICVGYGFCDFFVTAEIAPYLMQNLTSAGRIKLRLLQIPITQARIPEPKVKEIRDTVASLRLDSIVSAGFRISRHLAALHICAGKAAVDGLSCEKPDKNIPEGSKISIHGFGKIKLSSVNGETKKGRISITIHRYI